MAQWIIVGLIVALAIIVALRGLYRSLTRPSDCDSACSGCPLKDSHACHPSTHQKPKKNRK